jgi:hypothetical protein
MFGEILKNQNKKNLYAYLGVIVLILIIGIFWDLIFSFGNTGEIVISHLPENAVIFLDNQENRRLGSDQENIKLKRLTPGVHSVLISNDGYWPWFKEVEIVEGDSQIISPFFVFSNPTGFIIPKEDIEYDGLIAQFDAINLPDFENKKISKDGNIAIWVDASTLFAEWLKDEESRPEYFCNEFGCHNVIVPLGVGGEIKNVDFYKGRSDVFIVAFGNGVFAIEIDTNNNQNFQPIIEGDSPLFVPFDDDSIFTLDNNILMQVAI